MKRREVRRGKTDGCGAPGRPGEVVGSGGAPRVGGQEEHSKINCERSSALAPKRGRCRVLSFDARVSKTIRAQGPGYLSQKGHNKS